MRGYTRLDQTLHLGADTPLRTVPAGARHGELISLWCNGPAQGAAKMGIEVDGVAVATFGYSNVANLQCGPFQFWAGPGSVIETTGSIFMYTWGYAEALRGFGRMSRRYQMNSEGLVNYTTGTVAIHTCPSSSRAGQFAKIYHSQTEVGAPTMTWTVDGATLTAISGSGIQHFPGDPLEVYLAPGETLSLSSTAGHTVWGVVKNIPSGG